MIEITGIGFPINRIFHFALLEAVTIPFHCGGHHEARMESNGRNQIRRGRCVDWTCRMSRGQRHQARPGRASAGQPFRRRYAGAAERVPFGPHLRRCRGRVSHLRRFAIDGGNAGRCQSRVRADLPERDGPLTGRSGSAGDPARAGRHPRLSAGYRTHVRRDDSPAQVLALSIRPDQKRGQGASRRTAHAGAQRRQQPRGLGVLLVARSPGFRRNRRHAGAGS